MRLYHSKCHDQLKIIDEGIKLHVMEFGFGDSFTSLVPTLYDLVRTSKKRFHYRCSGCDIDDLDKEDVEVKCPRCGISVKLSDLVLFNDYDLMCGKCGKQMADATGRSVRPIQLELP